jgi:putative hydrolase of the HAD superfamily
VESDPTYSVLYDFGGVLVDIDFDCVVRRWAELSGRPFEALRPRFTHGPAYQRHERGEIELAEYFAALRGELGIDLDDAQFLDGWNAVFRDEIAPTVRLVRELAPRVPQYLLSNTNPAHHAYFARRYAAALAPLRRHFVSYQMGHRKPERAAFEYIARETSTALDRILFFDDTQENVDAANALGICAVLVRSPADVAAALEAAKVL